MSDKIDHVPPAQEGGDDDKIDPLGEAGRDFDAALSDLANIVWDRINHSRLLIASVQHLSHFLAWLGGHRDAKD